MEQANQERGRALSPGGQCLCRDHGNEHFLLGIESAKEIIKNEPAAFNKKKVIEKLKCLEVNAFGYYNQYDDEQAFGESAAYRAAIEIVEKGGIE